MEIFVLEDEGIQIYKSCSVKTCKKCRKPFEIYHLPHGNRAEICKPCREIVNILRFETRKMNIIRETSNNKGIGNLNLP